MIATTLTDLRNIARAGANKMIGYGIEARAGFANSYRVVSPEGKVYRTKTTPGASYCSCAFFTNNRYNPATKQGFHLGDCTCKHIQYCRAEEEYIARIEQEAEEIEAREWEADFNIETGYVSI